MCNIFNLINLFNLFVCNLGMYSEVSKDESAAVVKDFKDADKAQSHAKAQKASRVSNEGQNGHLLIAF